MLKQTTDQPVARLTKPSAKPLVRLSAKLLGGLAAGWAALALITPVGAAEGDPARPPQPRAERPAGGVPPAPSELAREGLAKMLQALEAIVQSVPQYHMPEITENGDIVIRRKKPDQAPAPAPPPAPPQRRPAPGEKGPETPI